MLNKMPFPTKRRSLELAAQFVENDLHRMRQRAVDSPDAPQTTSFEGDLMKAVEWAWAAATLRAMAETVDR